jgi:hypothetical protein
MTIKVIEELVGKIILSVEKCPDPWNKGDSLLFTDADGATYRFYHEQNCCEGVWIEDICGDLQALLYLPILEATETTKPGKGDDYGGTSTWTFYRFSTVRGTVTVRWCGSSNGYYSESVDFTVNDKTWRDAL